MKVESPLDMLSRAASIVQKEDSPRENQDPVAGTDDSGFEDEIYKSSVPEDEPEKNSPKRPLFITSMRATSPSSSNKKIKLTNKSNSSEVDSGQITSKQILQPPFIFQIKSEHQILPPSLTMQSVSPPPLIALNERHKYAKKWCEQPALFPRPSVISTSASTSTYTEHYSKSGNCSCCKVGYCTVSQTNCNNKSKTVPIGFDLPTVDDHFRKSLGDKYYLSKASNFNEKPSSVDEHFEKALGKTWYNLEYGKCKSS